MTIFIYCTIFILMMIGLLIIITQKNKFKRLFGLAIFQNSILFFYITVAFIENSSMPIYSSSEQIYTNPIPHVLMLTAIVVGVATFAVGLALIMKVKRHE